MLNEGCFVDSDGAVTVVGAHTPSQESRFSKLAACYSLRPVAPHQTLARPADRSNKMHKARSLVIRMSQRVFAGRPSHLETAMMRCCPFTMPYARCSIKE